MNKIFTNTNIKTFLIALSAIVAYTYIPTSIKNKVTK